MNLSLRKGALLLVMASVVIGTAVSLGVSALSRALTPTQYVYNQKEEGKIDNLSVRKTGMGWSLNRIYGKDIVRGCPIFWALPKRQETATISDTQVSGGGKSGGTVTTTETTTYSYYGTFAIAVADGPCAEIKQIIFNDEIWYNAEGETSGTAQNNAYNLANHLEIYLGTSNQSASPTIASYSDPTKVKFPYLAYLVIKDLPLASFGNELPSTIDVVVQGTENNLNTVLLDIGNRVGLVPNVDLIAGTLGNITVIGATLKQDGNSVKSLVDELIQYHFVTMFTDENGALNFVRQENNDAAIAIDYEDLGAVSYGSESVSPYEETIANIQDLPSEVSLSFQNVNDLFSGYTSAWVNQSVSHFLPKSISSGLVLTPDLGDTFCCKYLDKLWFEKNRLKISLLPEKVIGLNVRDKLSFPLGDGGNPVICQVVGLQIGADYRGEIDLVFYEGEIYSSVPSVPRYTSIVYDGNVIQLQPNIANPPIVYDGNTLLVEDTDYTVDYATGEMTLIGISNGSNINITYESEANDSVAPPNPNDELPFYGEPIVTILDINRVSPLDSPCLYLAIEPDPVYNSFGFTSIYASINDLAYVQTSSFAIASTIGTLQDNLPLVSGLDTTSTVAIELDRGTLSNLTTNEFDNDQQIILIGNEQIVVKNASLTDTLTYDVSYLKRGHNGTTPSSHSIGAKVYVLKGSGQIAKLPITKDLIGATIDIKAVPVGNSLDNVTLISSATIAGNYYKGVLEISGFSPTQGRIGNEIKIYGTGFTNATSASINGVYVTSFAVVDDTCITGIVGNATTTGKVSVVTPNGTGESSTDFVIITEVSGHTILDEGIELPQRSKLDFIGERITAIDDELNDTTLVTVTGGGGHTILDEGIELPQRNKLDFIGERITAIDDELNDTTKVVLDPPQWGDIEGVPTDQSDLWGYLSRSWRYAVTVGPITIPALNGTVDVEVSDASYFVPNAGQRITVKLGNDYCQFILLDVIGNTLTLQRDIICQSSGTTLSSGAYIYAAWEPRDIHGPGLIATAGSVDGVLTAGNSKYYGTNEAGVPGFYGLSSSTNTYGSFFATSPTVKNIPLFTATRATTINELRGIKTASGTATVSIQAGGVNVTGLTNLSITSSPQNFTATGGNTVSVGTRVTVNITAVSSVTDLEFTLGATLN